ncbi:stage III sporulation protein AF [Siminovitchia sp. FSL H7-0308]|uniref:Stage III sporulation protein AF n=1 Tax=Siminovitchia thermophila TaxID=1245522 RepID=A0ABS2R2H0_9BACI|nr:stage III sporulation protein AF [Siminovitchia thermophila]MBM7713774.1 stage III sporulation protein AF [Siminovitchia thermophila]ONK23646.1 stage III sporulation protein AF [Bacillus sp. VT-16-64]
MAFLTEWITNIVIFIMLAMIVDMLLPDSSMRKYVKLVTGLLLITIVITPVFKLFSADVEDLIAAFFDPHDETGAILQEKTEEKKKEIESSNDAYILKQMAVQMKELVEKEMINRYGMVITNINIKSKPGAEDMPENIQKITVHLEPETKTGEIKKVQEVTVDLEQQSTDRLPESAEDMIAMLSQYWDVPAEKIEVAGEGRNQ